MSINFFNDIDRNTKVYISHDCEEVAFMNGLENFTIINKKESI